MSRQVVPMTAHDLFTRVMRSLPWVLAGVVSAAIGLRLLSLAHPHEDAYILFKYARNLAEGNGIVYYPGGPHAEGATDFLWMVILAAGHACGVNVAYGAVLLNAIGAALFTWVLASRIRSNGWPEWISRFSALAVLLTGPALAGYLGFSATLYCGLVALTCSRTIDAWVEGKSTRWIPWLGLILALFRPDGVLLGGTFALIGFLAARRDGQLRRYAFACAAALVPAVGYAVWRRMYFGLDLPLPLYVKGHSVETFSLAGVFESPARALPGLAYNWSWLISEEGALPFLIGTIVLMVASWKTRKHEIAPFLLLLLPAFVLLASLSLAWQTQNIGARFQGPVLAVLMTAMFHWAGRANRFIAALVCVGAVAPAVIAGYGYVPRLWMPRGYANSFAVELGRVLDPRRTFALTEAGALSFWTDARVEDLVGLNSPRTAITPATPSYLNELNPDLLMFYAILFDIRAQLPDDAAKMTAIEPALLERALMPESRALYEHPPAQLSTEWSPEQSATRAATKFLQDRSDYDVFAVDFLGNFRHVWAIKKDLPERADVLRALQSAVIDGRFLSYKEALATR